ncbi:MAG TPA: DUF937 domain-containing protein [Pyrinomonadaceae bacterium]|nr:DUF937 domain-containing protein [Pyrinomonadaceae bacterium]
MFSLEDLLGQQQGAETANQIGQMIGANPTVTNSAIQLALPIILNSLANNAAQPQGAENLAKTLDKNHDGGILDNLGGFLNNSNSDSSDGIGILGHIFGQKQGAVAQQISKNSGLDMGQIAQILIVLAPIVMGYLGRQKQQQGLDAGGLSNILSRQKEQIQSSSADNSMLGKIMGYIDSNQDGNAMDDIASLAANYLSRNKNS